MKVKDALAKRLLSKDIKDFLKEVTYINGSCSAPISSPVNGGVGHERIACMWHENLLNSLKDGNDKQFVLIQFERITSNNFLLKATLHLKMLKRQSRT